MQHERPISQPPAQGGLAYVEPAKRLQQWLQGRTRDVRHGAHPADIGPGE
jgi:hypothetical protein